MPALSLLAEVIDTIDEPHLILDCTGRIHHQNSACTSLFGSALCAADLIRESARIARSFDSGSRDAPAFPAHHDSRTAKTTRGAETFHLRGSFLKPTSSNREALVLMTVSPDSPKLGGERSRSYSSSTKANYLLTPREMQVADLLTVGTSNKSIAEKLGVSVHTARHHTERVLGKLGAKCRGEVGAITRSNQP